MCIRDRYQTDQSDDQPQSADNHQTNMAKQYGYVRVSTKGQRIDRQLEKLKAVSYTHLYMSSRIR